jgi:23S rRNA (uracil1939-C5)-methyltransferase
VDAEANAVRNGITNCLFRQLDMKKFRQALAEMRKWGEPRIVVTDPPRAGMHPKAVQALCELGAERIVYVSCKPASLARDAKVLCSEGPYRLGEVTPVDMFPQTAHIESVAVLDLKEN